MTLYWVQIRRSARARKSPSGREKRAMTKCSPFRGRPTVGSVVRARSEGYSFRLDRAARATSLRKRPPSSDNRSVDLGRFQRNVRGKIRAQKTGRVLAPARLDSRIQ